MSEYAICLGVYRCRMEAELPEFGTKGAACFDIRACLVPNMVIKGYDKHNFPVERNVTTDGEVVIYGGDRLMVPTGLIFDIPEGYSVRFHPRSGTSLKRGLVLANQEGVVDYDYVNESMILLVNSSDVLQHIQHGERIAQAELVRDMSMFIREIVEAPKQKTDRDGGFGSTGTK